MTHVSSGRSETNWISFSAGSYTARAIREKNGEIKTEAVRGKLPAKWIDTRVTVLSVLWGIFVWIVFYILPIIKGYRLNPMIKNGEVSPYYYLISAASLTIISVIAVISLVIKDKTGSTRKNHGAEHKVFTAYKKLGHRIPDLYEVKRFPRICNVCDITLYSALIVGQLIGFFMYIIYGIMIPEKVLFFVPICLHFIFPFNFLGKIAQIFTTAEPDDDNIELAIAALTELIRAENPLYFSIQKSKDDFMEKAQEAIEMQKAIRELFDKNF